MTAQMPLKAIRDLVATRRPLPLEVEDLNGERFTGTLVDFDPIVEVATFETPAGFLESRSVQKIRSVAPVADFCI
jgi:hypothetical protein